MATKKKAAPKKTARKAQAPKKAPRAKTRAKRKAAPKKAPPITFKTAPEVLTPAQVQEILQISRATFFRWIQIGQLPGAVKIGDSWRVMKDELEKYLRTGK